MTRTSPPAPRGLAPLAALALALAAAPAAAGTVARHVPPAEGVAGAALELVVEAPADTPDLVAHVRPADVGGAFQPIALVRTGEGRWVAVVPPAAVAAPGVAYFVTAGGAPVFASAARPHALPIRAAAADARRARDTLRVGGRRSRVHTAAEWVDYGSRRVDGVRVEDRYYRVDADFAYRLWAYPLEELRVGYTRLLGVGSETTDEQESGFKVAGWFELGAAPAEGVRLDARLMVMATQSGFQAGGRLEGRLGDREASHVAVGVEHLADVGASGFFRLGWGTVPGVPMAATVEITELPAAERDTGVRLYYDVAREVVPGLRVGLRVGYAARNQAVAGFTGGASAALEF